MLYDKELTSVEAEQREKSVYHSDIFAMVGTLFLFCFWPSFNAGVAASGDHRLRAVVNTYISIASSVLLTYIFSCLLSKEKKFDMVHIQNATLAGGVGMFE
jgi:ammonium transporter Rh